MKTFVSNEIADFFRVLDKHVKGPFSLTLIGGAAASLAFRAARGTQDIDTASNVSHLEDAAAKAREESGLEIPFGQSSVFEVPYYYDSRLERCPVDGVKNLTILVPEKHDWALMKIARFLDKDKDAIKEVFEAIGLDKHVFLKRFRTEMTHIEPAKELRFYFLTMMEELYGKEESDRMEAALSQPGQ